MDILMFVEMSDTAYSRARHCYLQYVSVHVCTGTVGTLLPSYS